MPNPTQSDVHVNRPLTNISVAFMQNAQNFVADRVFPTVGVDYASDLYFTYNKANFNRDEMRIRAPSTESAGGGWTMGTDSYSTSVWALHRDIDDRVRANSDTPLNADADAARYLTQQGLIRRERIFATNFMATSKWTTDITGVSGTPSAGQVKQWNDTAATPIKDVAAGKESILLKTGMEPNVLVVGMQVWTHIKNHPEILDRIKYSGGVGNTNPAMVSTSAVAALMELDEILVMKSVYNTADEGLTDTNAFIGGKVGLLAYRTPTPGLMIPSAGYTFGWQRFIGAGANGTRIKRFRMEDIASDRVEIEMAFDMKKVSADLGYFFTSLVA